LGGKLCDKNFVTAAADTRGSCTIEHSNNYVYDATGGDIDHYHRLQYSHKGLKIASLNVTELGVTMMSLKIC